MKGIIVVDVKESCRECPAYDELCIWCNAKGRNTSEFSIPEWCPIKIPIKLVELNEPHSMSDFQRKGFARGYNRCIDEILKGAENGQEQTTDR